MRAAIVLMLAAACGRFGFDPVPDGTDDVPDTGDPRLLAYYPMDSLSGGVLHDATGHGHDGSCSGTGCPGLIAGRIGTGSLVFDGVDDVIEVPGPASAFGTPDFTLAWWVRLQSSPPVVWCPVNKVYGAGDQNSWQGVTIPDGSTSFITELAPAGTDNLAGPMENIGDNQWHHYAFTFDGTTKVMYIDGAEVSTDVPASPVPFDDGLITIGSDLDSGSLKGQLMGDLDDVRIYSAALGPAEIEALASVP